MFEGSSSSPLLQSVWETQRLEVLLTEFVCQTSVPHGSVKSGLIHTSDAVVRRAVSWIKLVGGYPVNYHDDRRPDDEKKGCRSHLSPI